MPEYSFILHSYSGPWKAHEGPKEKVVAPRGQEVVLGSLKTCFLSQSE